MSELREYTYRCQWCKETYTTTDIEKDDFCSMECYYASERFAMDVMDWDYECEHPDFEGCP